jgi:hypothetical protein
MGRCREIVVKAGSLLLVAVLGGVPASPASPASENVPPITVPFALDHNRMLVEAQFRKKNGTWRKTRLWVDTGAPDFFMSETLARDLGIELPKEGEKPEGGRLEIPPPSGVRIGGVGVTLEGVASSVLFEPGWIFSTMPIEANLPATVLKRYHVVFDYPARRLTLAAPGIRSPRGTGVPAAINRRTGIVQIDAVVGGESLSFALDNGASYSFVSADVLARLLEKHSGWPHMNSAVGCANIWGWWPGEGEWTIARLPEIRWGSMKLAGVGVVGLPPFPGSDMSLGDWYSQKTARPVQGFLGPNAFKAFRIEIDYASGTVYFERGKKTATPDLDLVGLTLRPEADGSYRVIGIARRDGKVLVQGVEPGDTLLRVGDLEVKGVSMGTVVDALRGKPGEMRILVLERAGERIEVQTRIEHLL